MTAEQTQPASDSNFESLDQAVAELKASALKWAQTSTQERIALLSQVRDRLISVAPAWAEEAARQKQIPAGSPLAGEEWISGP